MDNQTTQNAGILGAVAQNVTAKEATIFQAALNDHGEQLDKLSAILAQLEGRLAPLRNEVPADTGNDANATPTMSPLTFQVFNQTQSVMRLQARINSLLAELEV